MTRDEYLKDITSKIKNISSEDKTEILERIINVIPRDLFDITTCIVNDVLKLTDINQNEIDKKINEFKDEFIKFETLDLTFKSYSREMGYYYYEEVYDYKYFDEDGIIDLLKEVYNYGVYLVNCKYYKKALEVFDLIIYTGYYCEEVGDPEYNYTSDVLDTYEIDLLQVKDLLNFSLDKLYLYAVYASYFQNDKYKLIYNYLSLSKKISFEESINLGIEKINNLNVFYKEWIDYLVTIPEKRAEDLLKSAILHIDIDEYIIYKKSFKTHPSLYRDYLVKILKSKNYNKIIETSNLALTQITDDKIKEEICYIVIDAIEEGNLNIEKNKYYYQIFDCAKTIPNFLVLIYNKLQNKKIEKYIESLEYENNNKYYYNFFLGNFECLHINFKNDRNIIYLMLLYLSDTKNLSKINRTMIRKLTYNFNEYHLRNLNVKDKDKDLLLRFDEWKDKNIMSDELKLQYVDKLKEIINEEISNILKNKIRKQYYIAAKLTIALDEVLYANNLSNKNEFLNEIKKEYTRFIVFRKELKAYEE